MIVDFTTIIKNRFHVNKCENLASRFWNRSSDVNYDVLRASLCEATFSIVTNSIPWVVK